MTLLMRDQENREIGREEGRAEGREEGKIYGIVMAYKDMSVPEDTILKKICEKFGLTEEAARKYL